LRFMRARKWDPNAAFAMLTKCVKWRQEFGVNGLKEEELPKEQFESGKFYFFQQCKEDRPIGYGVSLPPVMAPLLGGNLSRARFDSRLAVCVHSVLSWIHVKLHDKDGCPLDHLKRWCIFQMETGRDVLRSPNEKITLVFDMTGFGLKNMVRLSSPAPLLCLDSFASSSFFLFLSWRLMCPPSLFSFLSQDYNFVSFLAQCFEAYYPESLGVALLVNSPWLFSGCWKIISPLLDPVVRAKVQFINGDKLKDHIDEKNIVQILGGPAVVTAGHTPYQPAPAFDEAEKLKFEEVRGVFSFSFSTFSNTLLYFSFFFFSSSLTRL